MNLLIRILKFFQSEAHALVSKFEDPVKLIEQGIRDLKKDFDDSMKSVAQIKAIAIGTKKELETKKQIAADYEQKAMILLQKAKNGELDESEADRLAAEALKKRQEALKEVERLTNDAKNYDASLEQMSKKILACNTRAVLDKTKDDFFALCFWVNIIVQVVFLLLYGYKIYTNLDRFYYFIICTYI